MAEGVRIDVWLWAVRMYKTRSFATAACRGGRVRVNRGPVKAASPVKIGDRIEFTTDRPRVVEITALIDKRVGAAVAVKCFVDHSPAVPAARRTPRMPRRAPGAGRPTKRERRQLDRVTGT